MPRGRSLSSISKLRRASFKTWRRYICQRFKRARNSRQKLSGREPNPRSFEREFMGNYTSGEESFPLDLFDACVDPDYSAPEADPRRAVVFGLDGAVSQDATALVGIDGLGDVVYARAWYPPDGGRSTTALYSSS